METSAKKRIGICFETPSIRDFNNIIKIIDGTKLKMYQRGLDYLKIIKDSNGNTLGYYNKINQEIIILESCPDEFKNKIENLITKK